VSGQPAAGEWSVGEDVHVALLGGGEHVELDAADEDRLASLFGAGALEVVSLRRPTVPRRCA